VSGKADEVKKHTQGTGKINDGETQKIGSWNSGREGLKERGAMSENL